MLEIKHEKNNKNQEELIQDNLEYNTYLKLTSGSNKSLPIMYWISKLHKSPVGSWFIIASKNCSTKPLSKVVFNVFKLVYSHIENFHCKSKFLSNYNKFWGLQNVNPVIIINRKKKAKSIATYDFT